MPSNRYLPSLLSLTAVKFARLKPSALLLVLAALVVACAKQDRTPPFVVVLEPDYRIPLGEPYQEKGALATDREDGVLDSSLIVVDASAVRTDTVAEFRVVYRVADAAGNEDSAVRLVPVFVRPVNFSGTWSVRDTCEFDTLSYSVTMEPDPSDSLQVLVSNWRNRGPSEVVRIRLLGRFGNFITVQDTLPDYTYEGQATWRYGSLSGIAFDMSFEETDTLFFSSCNSFFSKP
jgi:hypothetical protein